MVRKQVSGYRDARGSDDSGLSDEATPSSPSEATLCERQLWCAVILHTLYDAAGRVSYTEKGDRERVRRDAIAWFEEADTDFQDVCWLADLAPDVVRARALEVIQTQTLPRVRIPKPPKRPIR